jgi:hypothetical protein
MQNQLSQQRKTTMFALTLPMPGGHNPTASEEVFPIYITTHRAGSHRDGEPAAAAVSPSVLSSDPTSMVTFFATYQIISIQSFISVSVFHFL